MTLMLNANKRIPILFIFLIPLLKPLPCRAQSSAQNESNAVNIEALSELPLEDLLKIRVTVASKSEQLLTESPSAVTVYTDRDIRRLGYFTLADLADITPGYSSYSIFGERVFETRGQKADSFNNNKHLLLINGIPIHHARALKSLDEEDLPLLFAKQVEFLRGPVSALYGTGAFFGVVNVIPKMLDTNGSSIETNVSAGSRDASRRLMTAILNKSDLSESNVSLGYFERNSSNDFAGPSDDPSYLYRSNRRALFAHVLHRVTGGPLQVLSGGVIYQYKTTGMGEGFVGGPFTHELNSLTWTTFVPYLKYDHNFNEHWSLHNYAKYNFSIEKGWFAPFETSQAFNSYSGTGEAFSAYESRVDNFEISSELHWKPIDKRKIIFGIDADSRQERHDGFFYSVLGDAGPPYKFAHFDHTPANAFSAYGQYENEIAFLRGLSVTAGTRFDYFVLSPNTSQNFSPRFALVQRLSDSWSVRAQYGTALRAPGIKENNRNAEARARGGSNIPMLAPEIFKTFEAGVTYQKPDFYGAVTLFSNRLSDDIGLGKGFGQFINKTGQIKTYGGELETRLGLGSKLELLMNYSFARAVNAEGSELNDVPTHKANMILMHTLFKPFDLKSALVLRWIDRYRVANHPPNPTYPGNTALDLNFLSTLRESLDLSFQIKNVLDRKYKLPKSGVPDVPLPQREFFAGIVGRL